MVGVLAAALVFGGCKLPSFGFYPGATTQGRTTFHLWQGFFIAGLIVGGFVLLLILWAVFKYRRTSEDIPKQTQYHTVLEISYTVVPILIVLVLFVFTVLAENKVDATPANPGATLSVNAFQWGWEFDYPGGVKVIGQTTQAPTMIIPAGTDVQITLQSLDVLHGFYVPQFNFSRYASPGYKTIFRLQRAAPRDVSRPVHPALRAVPLAHVLQCQGRDAEPVRRLAARPAGAGAAQPGVGTPTSERCEGRLEWCQPPNFRKRCVQ